MLDVATGLVFYVVFLISTTFHEAAHAWAALRGGDPTAYHGGQVTLDPRPHIRREPFGMVILPLLTALTTKWPIGFASAPFDPEWALRYPSRAARMALAGPGANLILVAVAALSIRMGLATGVFVAPPAVSFEQLVMAADVATFWHGLALLVSVLFSLNLLLAFFNLLPLPPLDGSSAITLFMSDNLARRYLTVLYSARGLQFIGIFIAWNIFNPIFRPIWLLAVNLLHPHASYG